MVTARLGLRLAAWTGYAGGEKGQNVAWGKEGQYKPGKEGKYIPRVRKANKWVEEGRPIYVEGRKANKWKEEQSPMYARGMEGQYIPRGRKVNKCHME